MRDLRLGEDQDLQVALDTRPLQGRDLQPQPPLVLCGREGIAFWRQKVVAMQDGVQAVLGLGGQAQHLASLRDHSAMISHL